MNLSERILSTSFFGITSDAGERSSPVLPNSLGVPVCSAGRTTGGVGFAGLVAATELIGGVPDTGTVATDERADGGGGSLAKLRTWTERDRKPPVLHSRSATISHDSSSQILSSLP